eukprot:576784-Rhodomonas_salina.4
MIENHHHDIVISHKLPAQLQVRPAKIYCQTGNTFELQVSTAVVCPRQPSLRLSLTRVTVTPNEKNNEKAHGCEGVRDG